MRRAEEASTLYRVAFVQPADFGWDPVFEPEGFDKTYAELDKEVKNSISHRYVAANVGQ